MGQYLSVGIAKSIYVEKNRFSEEEMLERIKESLDLEIYNKKEKDGYLILEMKEDLFTQNIVGLMEEIKAFSAEYDREFLTEGINSIKGKTYEEMMEIAQEGNCYERQL